MTTAPGSPTGVANLDLSGPLLVRVNYSSRRLRYFNLWGSCRPATLGMDLWCPDYYPNPTELPSLAWAKKSD